MNNKEAEGCRHFWLQYLMYWPHLWPIFSLTSVSSSWHFSIIGIWLQKGASWALYVHYLLRQLTATLTKGLFYSGLTYR